MKNLISMTDFVLNVPVSGIELQSISLQGNNRYQKCIRYANFLKQLLQIWMFVPCKLVDGVWVVLDIPKFHYTQDALKNLKRGIELDTALEINKKVEEYQEAKERCLFDGFTYHIGLDKNNPNFWFVRNSFIKIHDYELEVQSLTIEILSNRVQPIKLTPTALKQLGL
jgi:hypothetical protein